jgi:hypothetical protein
MRLAAAALGLVLAFVSGAAVADDVAPTLTTPVLPGFSIGHPERTRFGALEWVGGFEIEADASDVGGFSGLVVRDGGRRLLTLADNALMMVAAIRRDGEGRPVGLDGARARYLDGVKGPKHTLHEADTESIDLQATPDGVVAAISLEMWPRVYLGPVGDDGFVGALTPVRLPKSTEMLTRTKGLESVAFVPASLGLDGRLIILGERVERGADTDNQPGWLIGGRNPIRFRIHRTGDYDLTDAKFGPDGRLYVLERLFSLTAGIRARIRRFDVDHLAEGVVLDGETIFEANLAEQIDNMEGLSIWQDDTGGTRVSLISDNNRLILQRTLYLEFRLME